MSRSFLDRRNQFGVLSRCGAAVAIAAACLLVPAVLPAQAKRKTAADHETKTGKITEVEKKGKAHLVTVEESGGEKLEVLVSSKTKFEVKGTGDVGFFRHPRAFVTSDSVFAANQKYFGNKFTIHIGHNPPAKFEADENKPDVFHIAGQVVNSDEQSFTIDVEGQLWTVNFEQGGEPAIAIVSSEPEMAPVGSPVEVEGMTRSGKFHPTAVVVNLESPLVADDILGAEGEKKPARGKAATASKTSKKPAKTDKKDKGDPEETADKGNDAPAADDAKKPGGDPFGVLNANPKKTPKKKTPTPKTPKPKKPPSEDDDMEN